MEGLLSTGPTPSSLCTSTKTGIGMTLRCSSSMSIIGLVLDLPPWCGINFCGYDHGYKLQVRVNRSSRSQSDSINQGLRKHQEVCFTPVTKVEKLIVIFCDLFNAI